MGGNVASGSRTEDLVASGQFVILIEETSVETNQSMHWCSTSKSGEVVVQSSLQSAWSAMASKTPHHPSYTCDTLATTVVLLPCIVIF